jgi:hypothetical protein
MNYFKWLNCDVLVDIITGRPQRKNAWLPRLWLAFLFVGGLYLWGEFINWGNGPFDFHDWAAITGPRLAVLRSAFIDSEPPLHSSVPVIEDGVTLRFLAIPDQILSPQIILLRWLDIDHFILLQFWLTYSLGFWALVLLRR